MASDRTNILITDYLVIRAGFEQFKVSANPLLFHILPTTILAFIVSWYLFYIPCC